MPGQSTCTSSMEADSRRRAAEALQWALRDEVAALGRAVGGLPLLRERTWACLHAITDPQHPLDARLMAIALRPDTRRAILSSFPPCWLYARSDGPLSEYHPPDRKSVV